MLSTSFKHETHLALSDFSSHGHLSTSTAWTAYHGKQSERADLATLHRPAGPMPWKALKIQSDSPNFNLSPYGHIQPYRRTSYQRLSTQQTFQREGMCVVLAATCSTPCNSRHVKIVLHVFGNVNSAFSRECDHKPQWRMPSKSRRLPRMPMRRSLATGPPSRPGSEGVIAIVRNPQM